MSTFEGGQRVPCIMWAPGRIPAGTQCDALASTIDVLPTIAAITDTPLPKDRTIDGMDISKLLADDTKTVRNEFLYYSMAGKIEGIREGDWKLLIKKPGGNAARKASAKSAEPMVMLFNLAMDLGEQTNLAGENPELLERLQKRMTELNAAIEAEARPAWKKPGA